MFSCHWMRSGQGHCPRIIEHKCRSLCHHTMIVNKPETRKPGIIIWNKQDRNWSCTAAEIFTANRVTCLWTEARVWIERILGFFSFYLAKTHDLEQDFVCFFVFVHAFFIFPTKVAASKVQHTPMANGTFVRHNTRNYKNSLPCFDLKSKCKMTGLACARFCLSPSTVSM